MYENNYIFHVYIYVHICKYFYIRIYIYMCVNIFTQWFYTMVHDMRVMVSCVLLYREVTDERL